MACCHVLVAVIVVVADQADHLLRRQQYWEDSGEKLLNTEHKPRDLIENSDENGDQASK